MKNKSLFLRCICTIIILSLFCSCDSNLGKVKKMEDMILCVLNKENYIERDFSLCYNLDSDLFTSDFLFGKDKDVEHLLLSIQDEWNLESITYIDHNWFRLTYDLSDKKYYREDSVFYCKIMEEDNKFKLDGIAYTYSQCISQINNLSYVDRIIYKFNSIKYDDIQTYFQGSLCKVSNKGKFGFINSKGDKIIPCIYDHVAFVLGDLLEIKDESRFRTYCQDSLLQVKSNNKYGLINLEGKEIIPCKYDELTIFDWEEKLLQVKLDSKYGLINLEGKEIIPCKYDEELRIFDWNKEFILEDNNYFRRVAKIGKVQVRLDNKYGLINLKGEEILSCKYDSIGRGGVFIWAEKDDVFIVKLDNKYGLVDLEGKEIIPCLFEYIEREGGKMFKVRKDNKYGLVDFEGKEIIPCLFEYIEREGGIMFKVQKENLRSYYTTDGTQVTGFYEVIKYYDDIKHPIFVAKSNGKWGYLNKNGDVLISFILDEAGKPDKDGTAYVVYNGQSGELDIHTRQFYRTYDNSASNSGNSIIRKACTVCGGTGQMPIRGGGIVLGYQPCAACGGLGYITVPSYWP